MQRTLRHSLLLVALFAAACAEPRLGKSLVVVLADESGNAGVADL